MDVFKCSLVVCLLLGTVYSQMSILNVTTVVDGQSFLITCDARRVVIPTDDAAATDLAGLYINTQTGTAQSYTMVAQYLTYGRPDQLTVPKPPEGRDWVFNFSGSNGTRTRDTMKIEVLVRKAVCSDAGLYKCTVDYYKSSGGIARQEKEQNVTSQAAITEPVLTLDPIFDAPLGWSNYSALDLNQTVTLTCRIEGPEGLSLTWRRERRPSLGMDTTFDKYPIANDIVDTSPAPVTTSTCSQHRYTSALTLRASEDDTERKYQCVVQSGDQDVATAVAVIDLKKATPDTTTYTTDRRVETASIITAASTPSPVRHDFKCHLSFLEVFLPVSLAPNAELTMKDPTCQLRNNGSHYFISFGYDECGTSQTSYSGSIVIQNEINVRLTISKFDLVEFVDDYTIPLQCTVLRNKTLHTAIQIAPRESFIESYQPTLDYKLKEYTSASYQDEITQYPSKVPINREIFLELSLTNPGSNTTGIRVDKCEATTTTDPETNPRYLLISNGCPSQNIVKILPRPGLDKFRFSFQAFHFSGSVNQNNVINVHCYMTGCEASACNDVCSGNVRRKRRSTRRHLVSLTSGTYIVTN